MDASRLYTVLQELRREYDTLSVNGLLQQLIATLDQVAAAPAEPSHMIAFRGARDAIIQTLSNAPSNALSPTKYMLWKQVGGSTYSGAGLLTQIESALRENLVTPQAAAAALREIQAQTNKYMSTLSVIAKSFDALGIRPDDIAPGEMEVGLSLPKIDEESGLKNFAMDLKRFDETLESFAQITGADLHSARLTRIASNDWQVFLNSTPEVAACVALAIERIVALYKNLLEIRKLKKDAEDKKMPAQVTELIQSQIDIRIEQGLDEATTELVDRYGDKSKRHGREFPEMKILARQGLNYIAAKIDGGATIEITVALPKTPEAPPTVEGTSPEDAQAEYARLVERYDQVAEAYRAIAEQGRSMLSLTHSPQPILHLTDATDSPEKLAEEKKA